MDRFLRKKILLANKIRDQLILMERQRFESLARRLEHLLDSVEQFKSNYEKLKICLSKHWLSSAQQVALRNTRGGDAFYHDISDIRRHAENCVTTIPPVSEIYAELIQAEKEFDGFEIDETASAISVETDIIELENIYLGKFKIKLYVDSMSDNHRSNLYKVIALDPHPPNCNHSVTHPHVKDDYLCEGDAADAIAAALAGGRICDFFTLVNSVINTYNSGSPYVSLDDWEGESCYECGSSISGDERSYCSSCDNDFCDYCSSYCHICDETKCLRCLSKCPVCGEQVCKSCLTNCPDCDAVLCEDCLKENKCSCKEEQQLEENENDGQTVNSDDQQQSSDGSQENNPTVAA